MPGLVDFGETYSSDLFEVRNTADALANAGTVTATITLPDGTTTTSTVANPATGQYTFDYLTSQAGLHSFVVSATGGVLGSLVRRWVDSFEVDDETPLISFSEGLAYLRVEQGELTSGADREQLRYLCMTAGAVVAQDLQRVLTRRTVTELVDGGAGLVRLSSTPVASVTTVTESGTAVDSTGYRLPLAQLGGSLSGILYRGSTLYSQNWLAGWGNVSVTYVAGLAAVNTAAARQALQVVRKVALNTLQGMWQATQQADPLLEQSREAGMFAATGALTPGERAAYNSLRRAAGVGIA